MLQGGSWDCSLQHGVHVVSYNCNSLAPNVHTVFALDADVVALQEARLTEKQAKVLTYQAQVHDYVLITGPFANKVSKGKYFATDKTFPGVAFLVKASLTATTPPPPDELLIWYNKGIFLTIDIFLQGRWITFCNIYAKHGEGHTPFLLGIDNFTASQKIQPWIVLGDFNIDVNNNPLPATLDAGFRSLGKEAPFDTISFRTAGKNGSIKTSFIDDILLSLPIAEFATPLGITWPRPFGHAAVGTVLQLHYTQAAKLEVAMPTKPPVNFGPSVFPPCYGTIPHRWYAWCRDLDRYLHNEGAPRGDHPVFRIREAYSTPKAFLELQQAFRISNI